MQDRNYRYEETCNAVSHALGAIFAIVGTFFLLLYNTDTTAYANFGIIVYSTSLISMFTISAAYHMNSNLQVKRRLRVLDHITIYFLIAGTYTPVTLITLVNDNGRAIFFAVWILAALGTLFKIFYTGRYEFTSFLLYILMGWLIVFDLNGLIENLPILGTRLLFIGGVFYTFGILFYAWEKIPFNHFIWHLFVLAGALSHWFMIFLTIV